MKQRLPAEPFSFVAVCNFFLARGGKKKTNLMMIFHSESRIEFPLPLPPLPFTGNNHLKVVCARLGVPLHVLHYNVSTLRRHMLG